MLCMWLFSFHLMHYSMVTYVLLQNHFISHNCTASIPSFRCTLILKTQFLIIKHSGYTAFILVVANG